MSDAASNQENMPYCPHRHYILIRQLELELRQRCELSYQRDMIMIIYSPGLPWRRSWIISSAYQQTTCNELYR